MLNTLETISLWLNIISYHDYHGLAFERIVYLHNYTYNIDAAMQLVLRKMQQNDT